jgi:hypothetical protein
VWVVCRTRYDEVAKIPDAVQYPRSSSTPVPPRPATPPPSPRLWVLLVRALSRDHRIVPWCGEMGNGGWRRWKISPPAAPKVPRVFAETRLRDSSFPLPTSSLRSHVSVRSHSFRSPLAPIPRLAFCGTRPRPGGGTSSATCDVVAGLVNLVTMRFREHPLRALLALPKGLNCPVTSG